MSGMARSERNASLTLTPAADPSQPGPGGRRHRFGDIYHEHTNFQFVDRSWRWALLSGGAVLVSLLFLVFGGLNLGIDFEGGTQWSFTVQGKDADAADVRDAMASAGEANVKVVILGGDGVRVQTVELTPTEQEAVVSALAEYAGVSEQTIRDDQVVVGPTWGDRVSRKAVQALAVFFLAIAIYLSFRFEWRMALAAIVAVIHDIIITAGVYAIIGWEVTPATVVAFLTILGFSLYDTVVVFDKVKENEAELGASRNETYSMMVNRSLNQVLVRSLNTSFVAVLPVISLLVVGRFGLGAVGLQDFALALFVGLITGAYSSIFVATPIVAWLKEREPRYRSLRERVVTQRARDGAATSVRPTPAAVTAPASGAVIVADDRVPPEPVDDAGDAAEHAIGAEASPIEPASVAPESEAPTPSATPPAPKQAAPRPTGGVAPRPRQQRRKRR
jgi:preprotein translocase subunit SecF